MDNIYNATNEQKQKWLIEAIEIIGFEEMPAPGIYAKKHEDDKKILVDLNEKQPVAIFMIAGKRVAIDDEHGTLLIINQIIVDAETGKMPTQSEPDEVVNVPKSNDMPDIVTTMNPAIPTNKVPTDTKNVPAVPEPTQACVPTEIVHSTVPLMTYSMDQIQTIKNTVAKGINDSELEMFLHISQAYGLDPFLKEIFYSSQLKTIMTSRDGYLKVAQRDPTFEGIQSMAVCENDDFEVDVANHTVKHKFGKGDRGKVIGGWAIVAKKGRNPVISFADLREYKKSNNVWQTYPSAMICKVAEVFALKRQFGISGLVTQEELE